MHVLFSWIRPIEIAFDKDLDSNDGLMIGGIADEKGKQRQPVALSLALRPSPSHCSPQHCHTVLPPNTWLTVLPPNAWLTGCSGTLLSTELRISAGSGSGAAAEPGVAHSVMGAKEDEGNDIHGRDDNKYLRACRALSVCVGHYLIVCWLLTTTEGGHLL